MKVGFLILVWSMLIPVCKIHSSEKLPADFAAAQNLALENPSNAVYLSFLAVYYEKQDKPDQAILLYQRCLELEPEDSGYYVKLARAYGHNGRPDLGRKVLTNAVIFFDHNPMVLSALADMDYDTGFFHSSVSNYESAMKYSAEKEKSFIYKGLGKALRELRQWKPSEGYFIKSLALRQDVWTYYEFGKLLLDREDFARAVWAFQKARGLSIRDKEKYGELITRKLGSAYYFFGEKLKNTGHKEEARKMFKKIVDDRELAKTDSYEKAAFWLKRM